MSEVSRLSRFNSALFPSPKYGHLGTWFELGADYIMGQWPKLYASVHDWEIERREAANDG